MKEHAWWMWYRDYKTGLVCCADCGIIQRRDGKNKPCKGKVKISFRMK